MIYTSNLYSKAGQLFLNKTRGKKEIFHTVKTYYFFLTNQHKITLNMWE